jgi:hypothetical protein
MAMEFQKVAKVLVVVNGGVAEEVSTGLVVVNVVDMDNIEAGDDKTALPDDKDWRALAAEAFGKSARKYVRFV